MDHFSDCAMHSAPAYPAGQCDCGATVRIPILPPGVDLAPAPQTFLEWLRLLFLRRLSGL